MKKPFTYKLNETVILSRYTRGPANRLIGEYEGRVVWRGYWRPRLTTRADWYGEPFYVIRYTRKNGKVQRFKACESQLRAVQAEPFKG